jgi:hypothetical protein
MQERMHMSKSSLVKIAFLLLVLFAVVACGGSNNNSSNSTSTGTTDSSLTPTTAPFQITSVQTTLSPKTFYGISCGSTVNFTFTTVITIAVGSSGGTVNYTWNIGSSHLPGSVSFASGDTSKSVTYVLKTVANPLTVSSVSGSLSATLDGNTINSAPVSATGLCSFPGKFAVTNISISVSPGSVSGISCNSFITFNYTATITVAPNTNGGTVILQWFRAPNPTLLNFGPYIPGQTTQTVTFSLTGKVLLNNLFPAPESITVTRPNLFTSTAVKPAGLCTPIK